MSYTIKRFMVACLRLQDGAQDPQICGLAPLKAWEAKPGFRHQFSEWLWVRISIFALYAECRLRLLGIRRA